LNALLRDSQNRVLLLRTQVEHAERGRQLGGEGCLGFARHKWGALQCRGGSARQWADRRISKSTTAVTFGRSSDYRGASKNNEKLFVNFPTPIQEPKSQL